MVARIRRVPRHKWTPATDEQRRAIAAARRAVAKAARADDEAWAKVKAARDLGVPARYLAQEISKGKTTVYRHTDSEADEGESRGSDGE